MAENIAFQLKMLHQVDHETDRELEISKSVHTMVTEIIKTTKGKGNLIEVLSKAESSHMCKKTEEFLMDIRNEEFKILEDLAEIQKETSEYMNVKFQFSENMKDM